MSTSSNSSSNLQAQVRLSEDCCLDEVLRKAIEQCLIVEFDISSDSIGRTDLLSQTAANQVAETILAGDAFSNSIESQISDEDFIASVTQQVISSETFSETFITSFFENLTTAQLQSFFNASTGDSDLNLSQFISQILSELDFSNLTDSQTQQLLTRFCVEDIDLSCLIEKVVQSESFDTEWVEEFEKQRECGKDSYTIDSDLCVEIPFTSLNTVNGVFTYTPLAGATDISGHRLISDANDKVKIGFPNAMPGEAVNIQWVKDKC